MLPRTVFVGAALLGIATLLSACSGNAISPVSKPAAHAFKTQFHAAQLPAVTAEYTLVTVDATPRGLVEAIDGSIIFAEEYGHALGRITPTEIQENPIAGFPAELTIDIAGNLWFTEPLLQNSVVKFVPSTSQTTRYTIPEVGETEPFPTGIVTQPPPSSSVWFTNPGTNSIGSIDATGNITTFSAPGSPTGLTVGTDNALYFTETNGDAIGRMDFSGNLTNQYPVPTKNNLPSGITAGPGSSIWFTENGCLVKGPFDCAMGKIGVLQSGTITEFDAQSDPVSIVLGDDGNLWFTACFANKIGRITPTGVVTLFAVPTPNSQPFDLVKGPNRTIWFSERSAGKIGVLSY
ncbi:MAG: hypothetical protein JOZ97_04360 [Candidatus Eremiobacteraeota bacterium]|nr:hypothetical protein [Candidatus Eremiobacteraeota bacterium]